jgi:hypothetical protein
MKQETINLVRRECPSLTSVPETHLSLALHYDGSPSWVKDVLFRVLPETWPAAVTGQLPLIHVKHTPTPPQKPNTLVHPNTARVSDQDLMGAFDVEGNNTAWKSNVLDLSHPVNVRDETPAEGMQSVMQEINNRPGKKEKSKTWEHLVREGALLGIH